MRTNVPGIWALGDCNGRGAFTHTSWNDFQIVAANLLDNDPRRVSDRITAYALYTDPPLGRAGMTEAEVRKSGRPALIATMAMEDVSRAYEKGETKGFMKILVDSETKQILGASLLDFAWHTLPAGGTPSDVDSFETASLQRFNVAMPEVPPRYHSTYFSHIWDGGYSAGYYAYT